jgi:hypothetical protein
MDKAGQSGTCAQCTSDPRYTHSFAEHQVAVAWIPTLLEYIKQDAFADTDRPLTYKGAMQKFGLRTSVRRVGRVLDAVELTLRSRGWPAEACGGVAAYVVNGSTGQPGEGWTAIWHVHPKDAREAARAHIRELTLAE